eukprot:3411969-Rhodomonas_salina.1
MAAQVKPSAYPHRICVSLQLASYLRRELILGCDSDGCVGYDAARAVQERVEFGNRSVGYWPVS